MSEKVYVVRYGSYSDQGIAAVFSSEEAAEKFCNVRNQLTEYVYYAPFWIDEYILDEYKYDKEPRIETYYHVWVDKETGDLYDNEDPEKMIYSEDTKVEISEYSIDVYSVKSNEYAKKVAIEQYQITTQNELENPEVTEDDK